LILAGRIDRYRPDAMLFPQIRGQLRGVEAIHADETDGAGLLGVLTVQDLHAGQLTQAVGPALAEVAKVV